MCHDRVVFMPSATTFLVALILACGVVTLGSCAGEAPKQIDLGSQHSPGHDYGVVRPDGQTVDQYVWPDTAAPPLDTWPHAGDSYSSAPFGCEIDADCFGRTCCDTPWGVKLCADGCD